VQVDLACRMIVKLDIEGVLVEENGEKEGKEENHMVMLD